MRLLFAPALVVLLASAAGADDTGAADLKAMVGKWDVKKAELRGKDATELFKTLQFEITAGGKYATVLGNERDEGTFTVDSSKAPKAMDVVPAVGKLKGKTMKAVYKFDGDNLTICYDLSGKDRPAAFESKPDTTLFLVTYTRKK